MCVEDPPYSDIKIKIHFISHSCRLGRVDSFDYPHYGISVSVHPPKALVIATGVAWRRLQAPGADRLLGRGVYYGAARTEALGTPFNVMESTTIPFICFWPEAEKQMRNKMNGKNIKLGFINCAIYFYKMNFSIEKLLLN